MITDKLLEQILDDINEIRPLITSEKHYIENVCHLYKYYQQKESEDLLKKVDRYIEWRVI